MSIYTRNAALSLILTAGIMSGCAKNPADKPSAKVAKLPLLSSGKGMAFIRDADDRYPNITFDYGAQCITFDADIKTSANAKAQPGRVTMMVNSRLATILLSPQNGKKTTLSIGKDDERFAAFDEGLETVEAALDYQKLEVSSQISDIKYAKIDHHSFVTAIRALTKMGIALGEGYEIKPSQNQPRQSLPRNDRGLVIKDLVPV